MKDLINRLFTFVGEMLSNDQKVSSERFQYLYIGIVVVTTVFGVWAHLSIQAGVMQEVPNNVYLLTSTVIGLILVGKGVKNFAENAAKKEADKMVECKDGKPAA
jgi:xanthine/uracil permease